jgi:hypothetical protein
MSVVLFKLIRHFILLTPHPLVPGLRALPFFYGITILVNVFSIVHNGPKCKCDCITYSYEVNAFTDMHSNVSLPRMGNTVISDLKDKYVENP